MTSPSSSSSSPPQGSLGLFSDKMLGEMIFDEKDGLRHRYRLEGFIGEGGFGKVYKARQETENVRMKEIKQGGKVAIKVRED